MATDAEVIQQFCQAVTADLTQLAVLHDREATLERLQTLQAIDFPKHLGLQLQSPAGQQAAQLLQQALDQSNFSSEEIDKLAADYAAIYLNHSLVASPYESVWVEEDGLVRQQPMFQIRAWYQRYHLQASDWQNRAEDHLVLQLQFLAHLFELAAQNAPEALLTNAAQFMDEHSLRWISQFATRVSSRCGTQYYAGLALYTAAYLEELRDILATTLNQPRPSAEEIAQRLRTETTEEATPLAYVPGISESW